MAQLLTLLATVTLHWTNPSFQADDICRENLSAPVHLTQTQILRAYVNGDGVPRLLRSHNGTAGQADTMMVPDFPPATYFVVPVNAIGASTCQAASQTVGLPSVGVGAPTARSGEPVLYDLAGRRVTAPLSPGIYFQRDPVSGVKRIVRLR